jgi:hypothetical protein
LLIVFLYGIVRVERESERTVRVGESTGVLKKPVAKGVEPRGPPRRGVGRANGFRNVKFFVSRPPVHIIALLRVPKITANCMK